MASTMQLLDTYVAEMEQQMSLSDLPEALLLELLRHLDAPELARVCVQDRRLRHVAGDQSLWHTLSKHRWSSCTAEACGGDWQQLYRHRATLPTKFLSAADHLHESTAKYAGAAAEQQQLRVSSSPSNSPVKLNVLHRFKQLPFTSILNMAFTEIMLTLFDLSLVASKERNQHLCSSSSSSSSGGCGEKNFTQQSAAAAAMSVEMKHVRRDMAWWLNNKPEAAMWFGRNIMELLNDRWDMWGGGYNNWADVLMRRSALQFLIDLQLDNITYDISPSITDNLQQICERVDATLRAIDAERAACLITKPPRGLPDSHWWYKLRGSGNVAMM